MRGVVTRFLCATICLIVFDSPVVGGESCKLEGTWRLMALHAEDVNTKVRVNIYGERPSGHMTMTCDGRFSAWAGAAQAEPVLSIWEDVASTFARPEGPVDTVYFSGTYLLEGDTIVVRNDKAHYADWTAPLNLAWKVGKSEFKNVRNFGNDMLLTEIAPMSRRNAVGNTTIARLVWERMLAAPRN